MANAFIIVAVFTHLGYMAVFIYIAAAWVMTAALTLAFGPRTTGKRLDVVRPVAVAVAPVADVVSARR